MSKLDELVDELDETKNKLYEYKTLVGDMSGHFKGIQCILLGLSTEEVLSFDIEIISNAIRGVSDNMEMILEKLNEREKSI